MGSLFCASILQDQGETFSYGGGEAETSTWTLGKPELEALRIGGDYWATLLLRHAGYGAAPASITVGTYDYENADAGSTQADSGYTELVERIQGRESSDTKPLAEIRIGFPGQSEPIPSPMEVLPHHGFATPLGPIVAHELGHALGIISSAGCQDQNNCSFAPTLSIWDGHLYDANDQLAQANRSITKDPSDTNAFYLPADGYAFFKGTHVSEVLRGAVLEGNIADAIPVNGWEDNDPELSHIELRNSMMSHQNWRNYTGYMEAELAIFQDLGFDIDRRNFFGHSEYGDNQNYTNNNGYWARNAAGTAYLPGQYNNTPLGLGLHVYGTNNDITQNADILSSGFGAAGVRVDGWNNTIRINPNVKIHANGERGTGLMVAYGNGHALVHQGDISATGKNGVGARFDFGSNIIAMGEENTEYRGSYIRSIGNNQQDLLLEQQGALVDRFDVSGSITGSAAAIYIANNAWVKEINVMQGAKLTGGIRSDWDPFAPVVQAPGNPDDLMTQLNFGFKANADGTSSGAADPNFTMNWRGNIYGPHSLQMAVHGGTLDFAGHANVRSFDLESGARLNALLSDQTHTIQASDINLQNGSSSGITFAPFGYGNRLAAEHTVLHLQASNSLANDSTLAPASGAFAIGVYDYVFDNARWKEEGNNSSRLLISTNGGIYNTERAGSRATSAPMAIALHNPASKIIQDRFGGNFARLLAEQDGSAEDAAGEEHAGGGAEVRTQAKEFWFMPSFQRGNHKGALGYRVNMPALTFGYEQWLSNKSFAGLSLGLAIPEYTSGQTSQDAWNVSISPYAGLLLPFNMELGLFGGYSYTSHTQSRAVHGQRYNSKYASEGWNLGVSLARSFQLNDTFKVRPFASVEHIYLRTKGYRENEGIFALAFGLHTQNLQRFTVGSELDYKLDEKNNISAKAYYLGLSGDRHSASPAVFVMDRNMNQFTSMGNTHDRHALGLGFNLKTALNKQTSLQLGYNLLASKNSKNHQGQLLLNFSF